MSCFVKRIHTEGGLRYLFFYRYQTLVSVNFHVSVTEKHQRTAIYQLKNSEGKWKLKEPALCPDWLMTIEDKLDAAIQEYYAT